MKNKHEFRFDLEDDFKELYGENYEKINEIRRSLFLSLENEQFEIRMLRNIIQNPLSVSKKEFKEWNKTKDSLLTKFNINPITITKIEFIGGFIKKYHLLKESNKYE
ncbi:TPA: hypothetical protein PTV74_003140 [Clostridium botulinum]|nr:hypothetical protein [Clostridium botulinum]EKS4395693.1 hypothetical protein [Clostridium botulinum]HDK7194833.1 hypothetical protein [Clostridium botulinum]HDK7206295.1 hypothetical protein [Clostridium botulinum]HDK7210031.1 hypothetical protein [Clostridium botulinum]